MAGNEIVENMSNQIVNTAVLDVINPLHVLFLHPSDNPNNVLVSELLSGENYGH